MKLNYKRLKRIMIPVVGLLLTWGMFGFDAAHGVDTAGEGSSDVKNIESVSIAWTENKGTILTDYNGVTGGLNTKIVKEPNDFDQRYDYNFKVDFTLSGTYSHKAGSIQVRIPATIFEHRNGKTAGGYTNWPILSKAAVARGQTSKSPLCYYRDWTTNEYVITNYEDVEGGFKASLQMTIYINDPQDFRDMIRVGSGTVTSSEYAEHADKEGGKSDPLSAVVQLLDENGGIVKEKKSDDIYAQIDTATVLTNVYKEGKQYNSWQDSWGTRPAGDDDRYMYVEWAYGANVGKKIASQAYDLDYEDDISAMCVSGSDGKVKEYKGQIVGFAQMPEKYRGYYISTILDTYMADRQYTDENGIALAPEVSDLNPIREAKNNNYWDYINCVNIQTVLVKYEKSELSGGDILKNTVSATLKGVDDGEEQEISKTAQLTYKVPEEFSAAGFSCNVVKNQIASGRTYGRERLVQGGDVPLEAGFKNTCTVTGERYTAADGIDVDDPAYKAKPEDFGQNPYKVSLIDDMFFLKGADTIGIYNEFLKDSSVEAQRLHAEDYSIGKIKVSYSLLEKYQDTLGQYVSREIDDYDSIREKGTDIYIKIYDGSTSDVDSIAWKKLGSVSRGNDGYSFKAADEFVSQIKSENSDGASMITLPEDAVAVKAVMDSYHYETKLSVAILENTIEIKGNEHTVSLSDHTNKKFALVVNVNTMTVQDKEGNLVPTEERVTFWESAGTSLKEYAGKRDSKMYNTDKQYKCVFHHYADADIVKSTRKSSIGKYMSLKENNAQNHEVVLRYSVKAEEQTVTYKEATFEAFNEEGMFRPQNNGTFYDLLPLGFELDISSVSVRGTDYKSFLKCTDVRTVNNWRETGRTMLIVKWDSQDISNYSENTTSYSGALSFESRAILEFEGSYPWEALIDYGNTLYNVAAYESGNHDIKKENLTIKSLEDGFPDDGGNLPDEFRQAFSDINEDGMYESRYMYAENKSQLDVNITADMGLSKKVRGPDNTEYSYGIKDSVSVPAGGDYSYRLRIGSETGTDTKNLIFYDSLENYRPDASEEGNGGATWQGNLVSIDTSSPEKKGAAPVIYYSTLKNLDIEKNQALDAVKDGQHVWVESNDYKGELADVKAIAIDISKKEDGSEFILNENESVNVIVNMQAPCEKVKELTEAGAHAYNDIYASSTTCDAATGSNEKTELTHQHYTQVLLKKPDMEVEKNSSPGNGTAAEPAKVKLDENYTYTITVKNKEKGQSYENVIVTDTIPEGLTVDKEKISGNAEYTLEQSGRTLKFTIKNLPAAETVNFVIPVTVNEADMDFENTARITGFDDMEYEIESNTVYNRADSQKGSLEVSKEVKGNMGDRDQDFRVCVVFNVPQGKKADRNIRYTYRGWTNSISADRLNEGSRTVTIDLKDSETVTFINIPYGITYDVQEEDYSKKGYKTAYRMSDRNATVDSEKDTVTVVNSKNIILDTGIIWPGITVLVCIAFALLAIIGMLLFSVRAILKRIL